MPNHAKHINRQTLGSAQVQFEIIALFYMYVLGYYFSL
jgi:hypothetical protein